VQTEIVSRNGATHCKERAAQVEYDEDGNALEEVWKIDGVEHRADGKRSSFGIYKETGTYIFQNWRVQGELHREQDLPAEIDYYPNGTVSARKWYRRGRLHRDGNKPARLEYDESGKLIKCEFYLHGAKVSKPATFTP